MTTLTKLYTARAEKRIHLAHAEEDYAGRLVILTPPEGWPGKNAEQREVEKARAEMNDETCELIRSDIRQTKDAVERIQAAIDGLEAERRDEEWRIRARLVDVLDRIHIQPNNGSRVESAFDDAAQAAAEDSLFAGGPYPHGLQMHVGLWGQPTADDLAANLRRLSPNLPKKYRSRSLCGCR